MTAMSDDYALNLGEIATGADNPGVEVGTVISIDRKGGQYLGCKVALDSTCGERVLRYFPYGKAVRYEGVRNVARKSGLAAGLPSVNNAAVKAMQDRFERTIVCPACK